jgi:hypothetical protein
LVVNGFLKSDGSNIHLSANDFFEISILLNKALNAFSKSSVIWIKVILQRAAENGAQLILILGKAAL